MLKLMDMNTAYNATINNNYYIKCAHKVIHLDTKPTAQCSF